MTISSEEGEEGALIVGRHSSVNGREGIKNVGQERLRRGSEGGGSVSRKNRSFSNESVIGSISDGTLCRLKRGKNRLIEAVS